MLGPGLCTFGKHATLLHTPCGFSTLMDGAEMLKDPEQHSLLKMRNSTPRILEVQLACLCSDAVTSLFSFSQAFFFLF